MRGGASVNSKGSAHHLGRRRAGEVKKTNAEEGHSSASWTTSREASYFVSAYFAAAFLAGAFFAAGFFAAGFFAAGFFAAAFFAGAFLAAAGFAAAFLAGVAIQQAPPFRPRKRAELVPELFIALGQFVYDSSP